jgi:hypothetical protein
VLPAGAKGALQLRPVVSLARFDFRELGNDAPVAAVQIICDRRLLCLEPEPAPTLLGADPVLRNESPFHSGKRQSKSLRACRNGRDSPAISNVLSKFGRRAE